MKQNNQNNQHEEFELLRAGFSDQANLLAEDELSDLFGGYCKPYCPLDFVSCPFDYCGEYDDTPVLPPIMQV
ncbi:MAG: hypothetical protein HDR74_00705 [Bacteroides sp.]|nr:hypothetical protein [Bacteroides sp.]